MSGDSDVPVGLELARVATELEVRGKTEEALEKYKSALALLLRGLKSLQEQWIKDLVREKFELFCERAEVLKQVIEQRKVSNSGAKSLPVATPVSVPGSSTSQTSPRRNPIPSRSASSSSFSISYPVSNPPTSAENAQGILSHAQKLQFIQNGFIVIRKVIPPDMCKRCIDYVEAGQRFLSQNSWSWRLIVLPSRLTYMFSEERDKHFWTGCWPTHRKQLAGQLHFQWVSIILLFKHFAWENQIEQPSRRLVAQDSFEMPRAMFISFFKRSNGGPGTSQCF